MGRFPVYNLTDMENNDSRHARLLELIRERVRRSGRSHRELEREMGLGHGTLGNILRGRTELRLRHIGMLGKVLGFEPAEVLSEVYGRDQPFPSSAPVTREELRQIIVDALQQVIKQNGLQEMLQD
jgi:transcriptional regulator with XRE-family HTH domain